MGSESSFAFFSRSQTLRVSVCLRLGRLPGINENTINVSSNITSKQAFLHSLTYTQTHTRSLVSIEKLAALKNFHTTSISPRP